MTLANGYLDSTALKTMLPIAPWTHAMIGDSHVQGDGEYRASVTGIRDPSFKVALASNGRLKSIANFGKGSQPSPMIASRIKRVLKRKPDVLGVLMGTNDAIVLGSSSYIVASLNKVKKACDDAKQLWYVCTPPPNNSGSYNVIIKAIRDLIVAWAAENGVRCVDLWSYLVDVDGLSYKPNYSYDGTHWTTLIDWLVGQYIWSQISDLVPDWSHWTAQANDPANLLFAPLNTAGDGNTASTAVKDPLFKNHRSFTQNSFTVDLPYLFGTQYGAGTNPSIVSSVYSDVAGVEGKVWTLTVSPNGAGGYNAESGSTNRIDVSKWQGRRLEIGFLLGTDGFQVDNTAAYLAANSSTPVSGFGLNVSFYDADGSIINTSYMTDPVDTTGSVQGFYNTPEPGAIPLGLQFLPFQRGSSANSWAIDHGLLPVFGEVNVPAGAVGMNVKYTINFTAAATSPVSVSMAQMSFVDIGPLEMAEIPMTLAYVGTKRLTAAYTLADVDAHTIGVWRLDATSAAFTVTLPAAKVCAGRTLAFKKIDASANAITLDANGSETIDGALTVSVSSQWQTVRLYSNGKSWDVV
jgi:hypothetical protein